MPIRPRSGRDRVVRHRKSWSSSVGAGMFEAEHLAALRIDAGHDVLDGAVLSGGVHGLKNQQQCIAVVGVEETLQLAEFLNLVVETLLVLFLRGVQCLHPGWPLIEIDLCPFPYLEIFGLNIHRRPSFMRRIPLSLLREVRDVIREHI